MGTHVTNHVNVTITCDYCNKQARRKETIIDERNGTNVVERFRSDLKARGWNIAAGGLEFGGVRCTECENKRLRKEGII